MDVAVSARDRWFLSGVFLTCMCGLMLQIMETRILSVIGYYHLAFFAIGVAMLGMTAGALYVFRRAKPEYTPGELNRLMSRIMVAFAWSVLLSLILLLNVAIGAHFVPTVSFALGWAVALLVLLPPYVLLGAAASLALTRSTLRVSLVYGVDLVGAAVGCLATLALLTLTDTYTAVLTVGAIGGLAALVFSLAAGPASPQPATTSPLAKPAFVLGAVVLAAGMNHLLGPFGLRPMVIKNDITPAYQLTEERWNSFSRVAMQMRPQTPAIMHSPSVVAPTPKLDQGWLNIDGDAGTPIYNYRGDPREMEFLRYDLTAFAYYIRNQGRSAVIGVGGGRDVLTASIFGFRDITGVEYNPIFVDLFSRDYRQFSGYDKIPGLRLVTDDARSWFARSQDRFDLVQMSMIDTWAATGAGAFTLSENGLYTVNGWRRFMARLTPTGVFTVSRWFSPRQADETGRLISLAMATLIEMGEPRPADHLYLVSNDNLSTLIVGRSPLTAADVATLDATADRLGYTVLVAPGRGSTDPTIDRLLQAQSTDDLARLGRAATLNLAPTWDSNPFFFNQLKLSNPASMMRAYFSAAGVARGNLAASMTLLILVVVSGIVVVTVVLAPARSSIANTAPTTLAWSSVYFLLIGVAFMFVELSLIQRMSLFLGHPVYGLAVVLFSVILSTGVGSLLSDRLMPSAPTALVAWPLVLAAYLSTLPLWVGGILEATETGSLVARASVGVAIIFPAGLLMGLMFPTGMRLCGRIDTRITPWLWAVNGAAGVLASGAAVLVAIETSLNHSLWVGAAGYAALALVAVTLLRLGDQQAMPEPAPDGVGVQA